MRVAQRKHRARKEQNIGQLEDEVSALRLQLSEAKEGLRRLEDALHLADEEGDVLDDHDVDAALTSLRRTLGGSEVSEDVQSEQWPENIANEAPAKSRSLQDPRQPGPFGALLYAYCIKLGHRILSNSDKPSIRLGQRLFHAWLRQMEEPLDEMAKLRFVRERLGMREARLGLVSDSRDREKTWRILKKPRLPGRVNIEQGDALS